MSRKKRNIEVSDSTWMGYKRLKEETGIPMIDIADCILYSSDRKKIKKLLKEISNDRKNFRKLYKARQNFEV